MPHYSSELIRNTIKILEKVGDEIPVEQLRRAVKTYLNSPGKLMRPRLTEAFLLSVKPSAVSSPEAAKSAAIVELLHVVSLLQDDVIDRHSVRRGIETPAAALGAAMSIVASDYLIAEAVRFAAELGPRAVSYLADVAKRLSIGQAGDLVAMDRRVVALYKTAPLFEAATYLPTIVFDLSDLGELAARLGRSIGVLYQLLDDAVDEGGVTDSELASARAEVLAELDRLARLGFDVSPLRRYVEMLDAKLFGDAQAP